MANPASGGSAPAAVQPADDLAQRKAILADRLIVTKTDIGDIKTIKKLKEKLKELNPRAVVDTSNGDAVSSAVARAIRRSRTGESFALVERAWIAASSVRSKKSRGWEGSPCVDGDSPATSASDSTINSQRGRKPLV